MRKLSYGPRIFWRGWLAATLILATTAFAADDRLATARSDNDLWQRTIDLAAEGHFDEAATVIEKIDAEGELIARVQRWLADYQSKQEARRQLDREEFERYVKYASQRVERGELRRALGWTLRAMDVAEDRDAFVKQDWVQNLVNKALEKAAGYREEQNWRKAWHIYSQLATLFEREPRYQKLEQDMLTHLRLDAMFDGDTHWEEYVEKVRWKDAERALEYIDLYYVEPANFKEICERGLEHMLLLTESKTARETFDGLKDDLDRNDFRLRVTEHLEQVRAAPEIDRGECVERFRRVVKSINEETIRLPEELVVSELMRGALHPLDEFTSIIWPRESKEFEKHTRGDFVGVGISIIKNRSDEIEVVTPLEDTPAYRAGIQAGDIIVGVDGEPLKNVSLNAVVDRITGPEGTQVNLTIRRYGREIEFPLARARVKIRSIKGVDRYPDHEEDWNHWLDKDMGIAYVRVLNFQKNTVEDLVNTLSELSAQGLKGLVLDLRDNPGGLLDSAWEMARLFLKRGDTVVSTQGRIQSEDHVFKLDGNGPFADLPLVVLVNDRSASASEIVSGAVRDNNRGMVVGERTFGKFSVQNLIPLSRSGAKLKITTARYYLPSGASLHRTPTSEKWGVEPDVPIELARWERVNVYEMQREANLLGPAPKPKDTDDDEDTDDAGKGEAEDDGDHAGDADKEADRTTTGTEGDDPKAGTDETGDDADKDRGEAEAKSVGHDEEDDEENDLPPIKQPDENKRPEEDPQLSAALLLMRIKLIADAHPTLATADTENARQTARP